MHLPMLLPTHKVKDNKVLKLSGLFHGTFCLVILSAMRSLWDHYAVFTAEFIAYALGPLCLNALTALPAVPIIHNPLSPHYLVPVL